jgi:membrane protein YqaA with SNARE-associated domain
MFVRHFGGLAFLPLGLLDMSFLAPGSFDALLIVLTAAHKDLWWYYALMASAGSLLGTIPGFQLGRKGGNEVLEKRLGPKRTKKIFSAFQRWGFWSLFIGAVTPPPMPASAFVIAAGALQYPRPRFLLAWTIGRLTRFGLIAWITATYGSHIFHWLRGFYRPALWTLVSLAVLASAVVIWLLLRKRHQHSSGRTGKKAEPQHRAA